MNERKKRNWFSYGFYRLVRGLVKLFYHKMKIVGAENIPSAPSIIVGNHTQMNGPICGELYFPCPRRIWCAAPMMHTKEVPAYAFEDFWSRKSKWTHPFYRLLSYIIAPLSASVFSNAHTIPVYHDARLMTTFKQTLSALEEQEHVIIFPECYEPHNNIVYTFQTKFVDVAKLYYKRTGKCVDFVPMYIAPRLKTIYFGKPIRFDPEAPIAQQREQICDYLMDEITNIAVHLPYHVVVPYPNLSRKDYPTNIPKEASQ